MRTPDSRNRYVDFLRAVAILAVVIGHWLAVAVEVRDGSLTGQNLLAIAEWTHLATGAFQVMPIFFLVGGYANAASWASARRRGQGGLAWLDARTRRLLAPTTLFVAVAVSVLASLRVVGGAVGIDTELVSLAGWLVGLSLWFLAVYLGVVALTPLTIRWHERWGARVPLGLGLVAGLADVARLGWGIPVVGYVNFVVVWLLVHQLGYAWHDGSLLRSHWTPRLLAFGGLAALLALVTVGPYPVSMVNVPGAQLHNTSPPSLALLALSVAQTGLALLLRAPLSRWCVRPRVWQAVVAVNGVIMSLYLWHMVPVALAAPLLHLTGLFPQPKLASTAWYALRPVWVAVLAVLLIAILVVVARFERPHHLRPAPEPTPRRMSGEVPRLAAAVAATGVLLSCAGLVQLTVGGLSESGPGGCHWLVWRRTSRAWRCCGRRPGPEPSESRRDPAAVRPRPHGRGHPPIARRRHNAVAMTIFLWPMTARPSSCCSSHWSRSSAGAPQPSAPLEELDEQRAAAVTATADPALDLCAEVGD